MNSNGQTPPASGTLRELAALFFKLGTLAFGGPAAHIAMMEDEVVERRKWMSRDQLLDLLGATQLIPGPNSTELAIHIGYSRAGWRGLVVAGTCFILPAMALVWGLAILYVHYQQMPQVGWLLYGVKPVIVAVVIQALWRLGRVAVKDRLTGAVGVAAIGLAFVGLPPLALLIFGGLAVMLASQWKSGPGAHLSLLAPLAFAAPAASVTAATSYTSPSLMAIFAFFLKVGAILYGSGYVLLAFLQRDVVERWHWLSSEQLLDAIAIGQLTPGPVLTTATFIGYLLGGHSGAVVATVGMFLPSFVFVALVNPWIPAMRRSPKTSRFMDGVNAASMALMAVVTWKLTLTALVDVTSFLLAILSAAAVFWWRVNSTWVVLGGAAVGLVAAWLQN